MRTLSDFTGLYQLSKTLRFELKPVGKTLETIEKDGLLEKDQHRADSYQKVKEIIDEYHKAYIEKALSNFSLKLENQGKEDSLWEYFYYYHLNSKDEHRAENLKKVQEKLRKQIANQLTQDEVYKRIDKKELIKEDLINFVKTVEERLLVEEFKIFTTYFTGFHENRKNMYSAEDKSTAIAYRLINENLPKFVDNMLTFEKVANTAVSENFSILFTNFEDYLNVNSIAEIFNLDYYNKVLTQTQIDVYNAIIGGRSEKESEKKIQGLNEYINLYNQKQKDKNARLPKLKPLYKQILSDRNAISWLPEEFKTDNDLLENIQKCYYELDEQLFNNAHSLKDFLQSLKDYDLTKIYIRNDLQLTDISNQMFGYWEIIQRAIEQHYKQDKPQRKKEKTEKYEKRIKKFLDSDSFSIGFINDSLKNAGITATVEDYFASLGANNNEDEQKETLFAQIEIAYTAIKEILNTPYPDNKNLSQDKIVVAKIKTLLDSIKKLQWFVKPLLGKGNEPDKDERFYGELAVLWEQLDAITPLYNKVRNYMTRKPYSTEKIKINFENSTLMDGWDLNKEHDNTTVILRKDGLYYLGIMNKKHNKIFDVENIKSDIINFEKMEYKLLPGANKMLPKVFFSKSRIDEFKPGDTLLDNYKKETHKKGENFNINDCHELIDFFKASINKHEDWKNFNFHFSDTNSYSDLSGFYRKVEQQGYKITFRKVSETYVNQLVDNGKLYLFQIYNKDFSPYSKGTPNMHTLYWKMLFDEQNLQDVVYKLNGQAEVFFRKSSISYLKPTHPANIPIDNKNVDNLKRQSTFEYDLIKNRRYTVDKFQFHVPITMNFKSSNSVTNNKDLLFSFNEKINNRFLEYLKHNSNINIIGIDRGERHQLYLTLIDMQGNVKNQFSLNTITNEYKDKTGLLHTVPINYHYLLKNKDDQKKKAQKEWLISETIKELKMGFLSQAIHVIAKMIIDNNAIVVLEDLNTGFKKGRQKREVQVYQKFEKILIDKLNYLVDKKKELCEKGSLLHALQLSGIYNIDSIQFQKQSGILFYVPAWNTSKMDPTTGFVNLFDTRYENIDKSKAFFSKFDHIRYNATKDWFEFETQSYSRFNPKADDTKQDWTLCTHGNRIETFRNPEKNSNWDNKEIDLTEAFKKFFADYHIDISGNLKEAIVTQDKKEFFEGLLHLLKLTLQMRNSITGTETDYLISPVANSQGKFYDSRTCGENLPNNADANGAYNIARKGLWMIEQIKKADDLKKLRLAISNKEWLQFAQKYDN